VSEPGDVFVHESAYVDDGATIGAGTRVWHFSHVLGGATIGERCTLGEYSFIGAGTVVTKDIPAYGLVIGVPGRRVGWMCKCGIRLPDSGEGTCKSCGERYKSHGNSIERVSG
jgi:serine acetyltransferase